MDNFRGYMETLRTEKMLIFGNILFGIRLNNLNFLFIDEEFNVRRQAYRLKYIYIITQLIEELGVRNEALLTKKLRIHSPTGLASLNKTIQT